MKTSAVVLIWASGMCVCLSQGFVNLNFEGANVSAYGNGPAWIPIADAVPGWRGYIGSTEVGSVGYNAIAWDASAISLHSFGSGSFQPIRGRLRFI